MPKIFRSVLIVLVLLIALGAIAFLITDVRDISQTNSNSQQNMELKIEDIEEGEGEEVKAGDTITVHYLGTLEDGTKFDSSYDRDEPFTTRIGVGEVIAGWDEGMVGMKTGGKRKLTIPPNLGYGDQDAGPIPANSTLIFEVELLEIQ